MALQREISALILARCPRYNVARGSISAVQFERPSRRAKRYLRAFCPVGHIGENDVGIHAIRIIPRSDFSNGECFLGLRVEQRLRRDSYDQGEAEVSSRAVSLERRE